MDKYNIFSSFLNLPRPAKQITVMICDFCLGLICTVIAFYLRLDLFLPMKGPVLVAGLISVSLLIPIFWLFGLYRTIFRYPSLSIVFSISISVLIYGFIYSNIITFFGIDGIPRSIGIIQPILIFVGVLTFRFLAKKIYLFGGKRSKFLKRTLIYGAGSAGQQLAASLDNNFEFELVGFLDDNKKLNNQTLLGYKIYSSDNLKSLILEKRIDVVLLAFPSISRIKKNQIIKNLQEFKLSIQTLPSISEIVKGKITISDIKELDIDDLLNRQKVKPKKYLLIKNIKSKVVLVTGAGGSIGSELCRQIVNNLPKKLILFELSEPSLHKINEDLLMISENTEIIPILGNAQDFIKMNDVLKTFRVNTVYHAAAYKHVPLVETNICEGVQNNIFSTFNLLKACINNSISNFVLISSDKAVRPTNIMGVTKRVSELCVQAVYNDQKKPLTKMSMVRFGNVLESSGSVIPKFKDQIKKGGPITLTHPDVTRYFMTVTEAAQLVIQASAMSKDCEVFILDMGESVKIYDLIKRITELSGLSIKDHNNVNGDIEIKNIGLRPGEKLYEELFLGNNPQPTGHEKIFKASETFIPLKELEQKLNDLKSLILNNDERQVRTLLSDIVTSYKLNYEISDYLYLEKLNSNSKDSDINFKKN